MTLDDIEPFERLVTERMENSTRDFVFDLGRVEFIDSRGLESLIAAQDKAGEKLGQIRLVQLTPNVRKILQITRLDHYFESHNDMESALKSLR